MEPATLYMSFPYPGRELLTYATFDGARSDTNGVHWDGGSVTVAPMPHNEVGPHLRGMLEFLTEQGAGDAERIRAMHSVGVLGLQAEPALQDERCWAVIRRLQQICDGLLLVPGPQLFTADGVDLVREKLAAPSPERVARRALVLLAVAMRGLIEQDATGADEAQAEALRAEVQAWLAEHGAHHEAEASEAEFLATPIGQADRQAVINAVWRAEGAQVLLWALGQRDLPPHDAQEHPFAVARDCRIATDAAPDWLARPTLRSTDELSALQRTLQGISWRMVQARIDGGQPMDFAEFAPRAPMGAFSLDGVPLQDGDLRVKDGPIAAASEEARGFVGSIAMERHHAANWLIGTHPLYGEVTTPT